MGKTLYRLPNFCDVLYRSRGTIHNVMNIKGRGLPNPGETWGGMGHCQQTVSGILHASTRRIYGGVRHSSLRTARVNSRVSWFVCTTKPPMQFSFFHDKNCICTCIVCFRFLLSTWSTLIASLLQDSRFFIYVPTTDLTGQYWMEYLLISITGPMAVV
jgi:hypothetical protein